jgi:hypothetical protein
MSWFGNTLSPTLEHVFASHEAPSTPEAAAVMIKEAGYHDVAGYVESLTGSEYEDMLWTFHIASINNDPDCPHGFTSDADDTYNYEHAMELKS